MADENVLTLILDQVRDIAGEVKCIPQLQAKIGALDESMRETGVDLRTRDSAQQQAIDALRLQQSEMMAAIAGISSTANELKFALSDQGKRMTTAEAQIKASFDTQLQLGRRVRDIEEQQNAQSDKVGKLADTERRLNEVESAVDVLETKATTYVASEAVQKIVEELDKHRPWWNGYESFARIFLGLVGTAGAGGLLYLLARAILGLLNGDGL